MNLYEQKNACNKEILNKDNERQEKASALIQSNAALQEMDTLENQEFQRLENLLHPRYKKTTHGPRAAARISLETMERECAHLQGWMSRLRWLAQP